MVAIQTHVTSDVELVNDLIAQINEIYQKVYNPALARRGGLNFAGEWEYRNYLRLQVRPLIYQLSKLEPLKVLGYANNKTFCQNHLPISRTTYGFELTCAYFELLAFDIPIGTIFHNWFIYSGVYKYCKIRRTSQNSWQLDEKAVAQAKEAWAIARNIDQVFTYPNAKIMANALSQVIGQPINIPSRRKRVRTYDLSGSAEQLEVINPDTIVEVDYKSTIAELEQYNAILLEKISDLNDYIKDLQKHPLEKTALETLNCQIICLKSENSKLLEENEQLKTTVDRQIETLKAQIEPLEQQILAMTQVNKKLKVNDSDKSNKEEVQQLKLEKENLQAENHQLRRFIEELEVDPLAEMRRYKEQLQKLKIAINDLNLSPIQETKACDVLIFHGPKQCKVYLQSILAHRSSN